MSDNLLSTPLARLEQRDAFVHRHLGPDANEIARMCATIGVTDIDALIEQTVPAGIRLASPLPLAGAMPEHEALARLKAIAGRNVVKKPPPPRARPRPYRCRRSAGSTRTSTTPNCQPPPCCHAGAQSWMQACKSAPPPSRRSRRCRPAARWIAVASA